MKLHPEDTTTMQSFTLSVLTHSTYENRSQGSTGPPALVKAEGNEGLTLPLKHSFPSQASPGLSRGTRRSWPVPRLCPHPQPYVLQGGWQLLQEEPIPGSRNRCPMQGRKDVRLPVPSPLWKKGRYGKSIILSKQAHDIGQSAWSAWSFQYWCSCQIPAR